MIADTSVSPDATRRLLGTDGCCSLSVLVLSVKPLVGGAWGWLVVRVGCARTPSLISVRDPGWFRIGDMMVDGVIRDAVRPLCL